MNRDLTFSDLESVQDFGTFVGRAKHVDADGAIRLQAMGEVLASWVRVLPGQGLTNQGLTLGLRVMPLTGEHSLETTVPLAGLADRFARRSSVGSVSATVDVPPQEAPAAWTALTPPRSGWQPVEEIDSALLKEVATQGITAVAHGTPDVAGAAAVAALRQRVWGVAMTGSQGTPAAAAFAAYSLGFLTPGQAATVHSNGPWRRLSTPRGHVLTR